MLPCICAITSQLTSKCGKNKKWHWCSNHILTSALLVNRCMVTWNVLVLCIEEQNVYDLIYASFLQYILWTNQNEKIIWHITIKHRDYIFTTLTITQRYVLPTHLKAGALRISCQLGLCAVFSPQINNVWK